MNVRRVVLSSAVFLSCLVGCGDDSSAGVDAMLDADTSDGAPTDLATDVSNDGGDDASTSDGGTDMSRVDMAVDAAADAPTDGAADAMMDGAVDMAADAATDDSVDIGVDMAPADTCTPTTVEGTVALASLMENTSRIAEFAFTGAFAEIGRGDGGPDDSNGIWDIGEIVDGSEPRLFSSQDVFPRERNFLIGSVSFDADAVVGCGVETVAVDAIDLSELWEDGEVRDIGDPAIGLWFFTDNAVSLVFGDVDDGDTLTFTDGRLTSIDVEVSLQILVNNPFGDPEDPPFVFGGGRIAFSDGRVAILLDDTQTVPGPFGDVDGRFLVELNGGVLALSDED